MSDKNQDIKTLKLMRLDRQLARRMAAEKWMKGRAPATIQNFVDIQNAIAAIDQAIADEEAIGKAGTIDPNAMVG